MNNKELREELTKITQDAIESQMDTEAYYSGRNEPLVDEIMELIDQQKEDYLKESLKKFMDEIQLENFERMLNQMDMAADGIDDNNHNLKRLISNCKELVKSIKGIE